MLTTRRGFFGLLAGAIAGATLDPDKLLWEPGRKLVSIPAPPPITVPAIWKGIEVGDIITIGGRYAMNPRTREELPYLQQFVITSVILSDEGDGFGLQPVVFPFESRSKLAKAAWKPSGVRRLAYEEIRFSPARTRILRPAA